MRLTLASGRLLDPSPPEHLKVGGLQVLVTQRVFMRHACPGGRGKIASTRPPLGLALLSCAVHCCGGAHYLYGSVESFLPAF